MKRKMEHSYAGGLKTEPKDKKTLSKQEYSESTATECLKHECYHRDSVPMFSVFTMLVLLFEVFGSLNHLGLDFWNF